jgi:hypothetical protein
VKTQNVFSDLGEAMTRLQGRWGPFVTDFPFTMARMDTLDIGDDEILVATEVIHLTDMADVTRAVQCGHLQREPQ